MSRPGAVWRWPPDKLERSGLTEAGSYARSSTSTVRPPATVALRSVGGSENESGPRSVPATSWYRFGTQRIVLCVQTVHGRGRMGRLDAHGRIDTHGLSAGGRKVASSNLAAPTTEPRFGSRVRHLFPLGPVDVRSAPP